MPCLKLACGSTESTDLELKCALCSKKSINNTLSFRKSNLKISKFYFSRVSDWYIVVDGNKKVVIFYLV